MRTWYRVTGNLESELTPIVIVHGGPGMAHNYLLSLTALAASGRAVIHYDQVGCGNSTHDASRGGEFWTVDLFRDELANLVETLGIAGRYHVLGQSLGWHARRRVRTQRSRRARVVSPLQLTGVDGALGERG